MSFGEIVTIVGVACGALATMFSWVWWLATITTTVKRTATDVVDVRGGVRNLKSTFSELSVEIKQHSHDCDKDRTEMNRAKDDHEHRIRALETGET